MQSDLHQRFLFGINNSVESPHQTLSDTDAPVRAQLISLLRRLTPEERLDRMNNLCAFGIEMMLAGIREQFPTYSKEQVRQELAIRLWGRDFVERFLR